MDDFVGQFDDIENAKNVSSVASEVKKHLVNVYTSLVITTLCSCLGVTFFIYTFFPPIISMIAAIAMLVYLVFRPEVTDTKPDTSASLRMAALMGYGFFQGATIGGLVLLALMIDPRVVLTAFLGTVTVFGCLTASALLAKRKAYLFLGGFLSSAISTLFLLSILNIFLRLEFLDMFGIYASLFVFCGYVLYDTQLIIEKVNLGSRDYIKHSAELFTDLIGIFVRILILLMKKERR